VTGLLDAIGIAVNGNSPDLAALLGGDRHGR